MGLATPAEEARGIDGVVGKEPISIKPTTYKLKVLSERIEATLVFYDKKKDGFVVEYEPSTAMRE